MANSDLPDSVREVLADALAAVGASGAPGALAAEFEQLRLVNSRQADAVTDNTAAVLENTVAQATSAGSAAKEAGKSAVDYVRGGLSPVINTLWNLFGGGDEPKTPAPLPEYVKPQSIRFEGEVSTTGGVEWTSPAGFRDLAAAPAAQVTVQVNAMDSRSFLDHKDEIARAVREAMLNSHSLNDVVREV